MNEQEEVVGLGIINEVGDLGLGFEPISEEDAEKIKKDDE